MYTNQIGSVVRGVYARNAALASSVVRPPSRRFSVTAGRKQRRLRTDGAGVCQHVLPGPTSSRSASHSTVDSDEVKRFKALASKWWDEQGEFAALHAMNDLRVPFIRDNLLSVHEGCQPGKPLKGLRILDVGCGGGLLTEPLARLGANVLGIDPVEESIGTARLHSSCDPDLREQLRYCACTLEELSGRQEIGVEEEEEEEGGAGQFDAVVASEVVEHLADLETFAFCCNHMLKPGGSLFITTINKTRLSYLLGIVVAEQILRIVPSGTHDWNKFISPTELERLLESNGFLARSVRGMLYNPMMGRWSWSDSTDINYALHAVKRGDEPRHERAEASGPEQQQQCQVRRTAAAHN